MSEFAFEEPQQLDLFVTDRSETGVAAFRRNQLVATTFGGQQRGFPQSGTSCNHRNVPVQQTRTGIDNHRIGFGQMDNALRSRAEVIDERHRNAAQRARNRLVGNPPTNIARGRGAADYRSGYAKARRRDFTLAGHAEEFRADTLHGRKFRGRKAGLAYQDQASMILGENSEQGFGSPDVAREQQPRHAVFSPGQAVEKGILQPALPPLSTG